MNLELTDEQLALRDSVRRFLADRSPVAASVRTTPDDLDDVAQAVWRGLVDLGIPGLLVPEDLGGSGATMVEAGLVLEELGRVLAPAPWLSTAVATRALVRLGTDDAAKKLLTGIAEGSVVATLAFAEGSDGASWASPDTRATRSGGELVLARTKVAVPDVERAIVILAIAADDDGAALFAVDASAPGLLVRPHHPVDLTRPLSQVSFRDTPARRLGAASSDALQALVDDVLVAWATDALGAAQAIFELTLAYAHDRVQFGSPIGSFQAVQHLCVDMYETIELARSGVIHAWWTADHADAAERHLGAVRAKAFAGRLATVGETAIQVFGGIGFTWEHDAHLYLRRLLAWSAFLGAPGPYLQELGSQLADPARQNRRSR